MISKKTSLHAYHAFLYTILLSLDDYNGVVKGEMKFETLRITFLGTFSPPSPILISTNPSVLKVNNLSVYPYTILVVDPNTRLFTS